MDTSLSIYSLPEEGRHVKVRFTSRKHGVTAGLIFLSAEVRKLGIAQISRYFPYSEFRKMERLEVSPDYPDWESAFFHSFDAPRPN